MGLPLAAYRPFVPPPASQRIFLFNPVAVWNLNDPSGTTALEYRQGNSGSYAGTFTLAQNALGDGSLYTSFGGGRVSLATPLTALNTAMGDKSAGTMFCWAKVSGAGVWTDATSRILFEIGADASNRVFFNKPTTSNRLDMFHNAGGTSKQIIKTSFSPTTWFSLALTWDKPADQVKSYINGEQNGAIATGLGVWSGNLASGFTAIADFSSAGSAPWSGFMGRAALFNYPLLPNQVAMLHDAGYAGN